LIKDWLQQCRSVCGHFTDDLPSDFVFCRGWKLVGERLDSSLPGVELFFQNADDNDGIARRTDCAVFERIL
jgi:hypothetical protein